MRFTQPDDLSSEALRLENPVRAAGLGEFSADTVHEQDAGVRAAWCSSFLGHVANDDVRRELLADSVLSTFAAGHLIHETGYEWLSEPYPVRLLVDGIFRGHLQRPNGRQATLQYMRPGDIWGLLRMLGHPPFERRVLFQALAPSRVLMIRGSRFTAMLESEPAVAVAVARELGRTVMQRTSALQASVFSSMAGRIAHHLVQLAVDDPETGQPTVRVSRQDLADAIGTVPAMVTRMLVRLRSRGLVEFSGRAIEIPDVQALAREVLAG